eukprot:2293379-Prymnesium_polylepis.1
MGSAPDDTHAVRVSTTGELWPCFLEKGEQRPTVWEAERLGSSPGRDASHSRHCTRVSVRAVGWVDVGPPHADELPPPARCVAGFAALFG